MLQFFRKYQKVVFISVTFFVAVSFLFFGPVTRGMQPQTFQDRQIALGIDGYPIMHSEVKQMAHFLMTDALDMPTGHEPLNLLNDGVLKKDFLKSSLAESIFEAYPEAIQPILSEKLERAKKFRPYVHPYFQQLSAENIWKQLSPTMMENISALQKMSEPSKEAFSQLTRLYLLQSEFPAYYLKQMIAYQEKQFGGAARDPSLDNRELQLFGFRTIQDWFGSEFAHLCAQMIINTARLAQSEGITVSDQEVQDSVLANFQSGITAKRLEDEGSFDELFHQQLKVLGLDFKKAKSLWKQVLLFRAYFQQKQAQMSSANDELSTSSDFDKAIVELYQMQPSVQLRSLEDLLKLELYLQAVANKPIGEIDLPHQYDSARLIAEKAPSLVYQTYHVKVAKVNKKDLSLRVSLRELLDYQLHPKHWKLLEEQFSALKTSEPISRDLRFQRLESLDPELRKNVDQYSMKLIVEDHPEWIEEELQSSERKEYTLEVSSEPEFLEFPEIKKPEEFVKWLAAAELGSSWDYTEDAEVYFSVTVESKDETQMVFTFSEAQKKRKLDALLTAYLKNGYPEWRKRAPAVFQDNQGNWKSVYQVRNELIPYALRDLFKALDKGAIGRGESVDWKEGFGEPPFYVKERFVKHLEDVKAELLEKGQSKWTHPDVLVSKLEKQWAVNSKEYTLLSSRLSDKEREEISQLGLEEYSSILDASYGPSVYFFQLKDKGQEEAASQHIGKGAVDSIASGLIEQLKAKGSIQCIGQQEQEDDDSF